MMSPNRNGDLLLSKSRHTYVMPSGWSVFCGCGTAHSKATTPTAILTHWHASRLGRRDILHGCSDPDDSHYEPLALMRKDLEALRTPTESRVTW